MKITLLTDGRAYFLRFVAGMVERLSAAGHSVEVVNDHRDTSGGDVLGVLSYFRIVPVTVSERFGSAVVVHASDLPKGRGFSPMSWQILEGSNDIVFTIFELSPGIDEGDVYFKRTACLRGTELYDEWREVQASMVCSMFEDYVAGYSGFTRAPQSGEATLYERRTEQDDRVEPDETLGQIFDKLRIADPENFPVWFEIRGRKFALSIRALESDESTQDR